LASELIRIAKIRQHQLEPPTDYIQCLPFAYLLNCYGYYIYSTVFVMLKCSGAD